MGYKTPSIQTLLKQLGPEYEICTIDLENCLFRDLKNGYNVEISGANGRGIKQRITLYLWFGTKCGYNIMISKIRNVERSAEAISNAVEILKEFTDNLVECGYDSGEALRKVYLYL